MAVFNESVFINCPFDYRYKPLLDAMVFVVHDCGYVARTALEHDDATQVRLHKIFQLIEGCRLGIHDISRTELDPSTKLPRFNMPLELGIFMGAKQFGSDPHDTKRALVLDRDPYRYQQFCSDIAGQDPKSHDDDPATLMKAVRNWLRSNTPKGVMLPGPKRIWDRYLLFMEQLPEYCDRLHLDPSELIFNDYTTLAAAWLQENELP